MSDILIWCARKSCLIRIHSVCFHDKKSSLKYSRIYAANVIRRWNHHKKYGGGIRWAPGVWGIWGELLFIFRELGSTGYYFRNLGGKLIILGIKEALQKSKKNLTLKEKLSFCLIFFLILWLLGVAFKTPLRISKCTYFRAYMMIWIGIGDWYGK